MSTERDRSRTEWRRRKSRKDQIRTADVVPSAHITAFSGAHLLDEADKAVSIALALIICARTMADDALARFGHDAGAHVTREWHVTGSSRRLIEVSPYLWREDRIASDARRAVSMPAGRHESSKTRRRLVPSGEEVPTFQENAGYFPKNGWTQAE